VNFSGATALAQYAQAHPELPRNGGGFGWSHASVFGRLAIDVSVKIHAGNVVRGWQAGDQEEGTCNESEHHLIY
jgi:hypothetical protein